MAGKKLWKGKNYVNIFMHLLIIKYFPSRVHLVKEKKQDGYIQ